MKNNFSLLFFFRLYKRVFKIGTNFFWSHLSLWKIWQKSQHGCKIQNSFISFKIACNRVTITSKQVILVKDKIPGNAFLVKRRAKLLFSVKNNTFGITVLTFLSNFSKRKRTSKKLVPILKTLLYSLKKKNKEKIFFSFLEKIKGGQVPKSEKNWTFFADRNFWPINWPMTKWPGRPI